MERPVLDFVMGLPVFINCKGDIYDSILVIVDRLMKMIHYEPIKVIVDASALVESILDIVV